ncbi:MAG TPA: NADP-dependent malic enzyme [Candidatus Faecimorpha stercoravium]|nr:NADP-dependent malic enzyme [Candidatus Faecimorpha stercoravium]
MTQLEKALQLHEEWKGKLRVEAKMKVDSREALSMAYTPGVAEPCKKIHENPEDVYKYTMKGNFVAVVTDGTAVLGLGDIGPEAAMPVMEGKAVLFKEFGGVDAVPICLSTKDPEEIIETVKRIAPTFGGINLEDISAPRCFEIEKRLREELDIPVFHDDQHGTAMVVLAALTNALRVVGKSRENARVVVNGAGAAGIAISKLLLADGFGDVVLCDKVGILQEETPGMNPVQAEMSRITNKEGLKGSLADALAGADIFVGVSAPNIVTQEMVASMNSDAIVFAMANPVPEIMPDVAKAGGARIVGTGRSDFPNQINNVLVFPGLFKGALAARCKITEEIKLGVAHVLANMIPAEELTEENLIPYAFDPRVADTIANEVIRIAKQNG